MNKYQVQLEQFQKRLTKYNQLLAIRAELSEALTRKISILPKFIFGVTIAESKIKLVENEAAKDNLEFIAKDYKAKYESLKDEYELAKSLSKTSVFEKMTDDLKDLIAEAVKHNRKGGSIDLKPFNQVAAKAANAIMDNSYTKRLEVAVDLENSIQNLRKLLK